MISKPRSWGRLGCFGVIGILAAIGALALLAILARGVGVLYTDEVSREVFSPDRSLVAYQQVTKGGFGTVWTTKVLVRSTDSRGDRLIYRNQDSSFEPPFRWEGPETLRIMLPCGRIGFLSNPTDYAKAKEPIGRLTVRWSYIRPDCGPGSPHSENDR